MATSKTDPSRKGKQKAFSQAQQAQATKKATGPRTQIVPSTQWESKDLLLIRGDLLEAFNKTLEVFYSAFQQLGMIYQQVIALNVQSDSNPEGKIKFNYIWDNGEKVSDQDLEVFKRKMGQIQALRNKQAQEVQQLAQVKEGPQSNLVTADGQPLTEETLENAHKIIS
jgi:hypothetical protein